jgi:hypothetical protein
MLTGSVPFTASDPMEWVHCHIARKPVPPAERLPNIPAALSAIVMKLLAKTAEERYQTAAGVESDLRRCLTEWETQCRIDEFPLGEHDTPDRLLIPEKLYGRESEIDALLAAFDRVVAGGKPELVLVSGYSGVGKSSVVNELHKSLVLLVAAGLWWITPKETPSIPHGKASGGILATYKIVFSNPQSYLCGLAAGLLFVPTTVGDMVWGVRFFQTDKLFSFSDAVFAISMVPLGWVLGCPLLGWVADRLGRRKPVYLGGAAIMLIAFVQLIYAPTLLPSRLTLFILGVASGAAMIPYTIIKEVNPDEVKGSATGAINFLTFAVTAAIGPIFAEGFGKTLGAQAVDAALHFRHAGLFWIGVLIAALVVGSMLRETGRVHSNQAA